RLLEHLGVQEVQLVAHDWGAAVALAFVEREPDRVQKLVLCNPPPAAHQDWPRILNWWRARGLGELLMGAIPKGLFARELRRGTVRADAWPDARVNAVWDQFDQGTQRAILRLVRSAQDDLIGGGGLHPENALTDNAVVLWGEADPWYPPATAGEYAA